MKAVELALKSGRLRQSSITSFVHHHDNLEHAKETIPIYENFCFVLALFRTRTAENVLEAKALLDKLFGFQTESGFPIYLHEYPACHSSKLLSKLAPIAHFLLRDFTSILGESLRSKLQKIVTHLNPPTNSQTPEEWADFLIHTQITHVDPTPALQLWDDKALCFVGAQKQKRYEPAVTLFDLILGEWTQSFSPRAFQDCPAHLQAALIFPNQIAPVTYVKQWERRFWGDGNPTHSAVFQTKGVMVEEEIVELPAADVQDEIESSFFFNRDDTARVTINGVKATTFQLDEPVIFESGGKKFKIVFSLQEGQGKFWGHIHFGNRKGQIGSIRHEAFDWHIALRTIDRSQRCLIKVIWTEI